MPSIGCIAVDREDGGRERKRVREEEREGHLCGIVVVSQLQCVSLQPQKDLNPVLSHQLASTD
jgi:hypothetical protein